MASTPLDLIRQRTKKIINYKVVDGDTLKKIAFKIYGDIRASDIIAFYNELLSDDDLEVGQIILVPFVDRPMWQNFFDVYGTDFQLGGDGGLTVDNDGDIQTVYGLQNIINAVTRRLETAIGTYLRNINYGMGYYIGYPGKDFYYSMIKVHVVNAILQEDRVQVVQDVRMTIKKDTITIEVDIVTEMFDTITITKELNTNF